MDSEDLECQLNVLEAEENKMHSKKLSDLVVIFIFCLVVGMFIIISYNQNGEEGEMEMIQDEALESSLILTNSISK